MGNMIKSRLAAIGKRQVDLLPELDSKGYKIAPSQLSLYISGRLSTPQAGAVRDLIYEILEKWEKPTA